MNKLTITRCDVDNGKVTARKNKEDAFELMLNPAQYKHGHSISYSGSDKKKGEAAGNAAHGKTGTETRFAATNAEKLSFEFVIDGTGVVRRPGTEKTYPDVNAQINQFKQVAYLYEGEEHEPPVVRLSWGALDLSGINDSGKFFYGRLESLDIQYTLFKPSGEPLRARVSAGFVSFMTLMEAEQRANKSSPDLSHLVEVRAGDTLPLLCQRIYKDSRQHLVVARANRLSNFRDLKPGTVLRFPRLG
jgi:nucleoid-associated protein YgaU